ncbi:hypothetical protein MCOR02_007173 [Pyricularia oryzae]|uniref:Uncharacterized protein n=2 Tax=Pyricularia oryzae TaxID=318829 RepID=G4NH00_PYRO7|nr:uncharacterized protein MGG_17715 [Pyricularia oryzae 70-15]KAH9432478.1 hypothetical protein MCOR02_007173 [Pyricularia oryzae]EHA47510.1 hypothetical protein MGG_17715 [Pyricularia oryzae 70-15]KAI7923957.1 hypothetical protein M9X92_004091 [Pyricularia oryzae]KAI7932603.1 hypothetical protein M0657_000352 [Pyricularia oryzae]QBZ64763.1 hypothetical protein PoMZ_06462 [Pyricularia oryzae]
MIEALCHLTSTPPRKEAGGTLFASRLPNRSKDWGMNLLVTAGICTLSAGTQPRHGLLGLRACCTVWLYGERKASSTTDGGRSGRIVNTQKATSEEESPVARLVWSDLVDCRS